MTGHWIGGDPGDLSAEVSRLQLSPEVPLVKQTFPRERLVELVVG